MKLMQRGVSWIVLVTLLVAAIGVTVETPSVRAQVGPVPDFEPAPCMFELPADAVEGENIECGYLIVPENHADPSGPTLRLAVAIVKSTSSTPAPDPLVMEQGGPGGSSLDAFVEDLFGAIMVLRAERDVIILEQRGTLYSEPSLVCQEVLDLNVETMQQNLRSDDETPLYEAAIQACRERLVAEGINLSNFDSVENAADIADLANALQLTQINLYGVSYGTMLALHALRDFPQIMRSVTIDSVVPLQTNFITEVPQSANRAFRMLFDTCAADPACNEAMPNLEADFYALAEELNANPITFPVEDPDTGETYQAVLNGERLIAYYFQMLYATSILPYLPKTVYDIQSGNTSLLSLVAPFFDLDRTFADAMYYSVICAEDADYTLLDYDLAGVPETLAAFFGEDTILTTCASWGVEALPASVDDPVVSDVPVMVMSGEFDPITPPDFAAQAAETLSNAYNYVYPGVGHGALFGGDCPLSMFIDFLDDPTSTPDDTCISGMSIDFLLPSEQYADPIGRFTAVVPEGWELQADGSLSNPANGSTIQFSMENGDDLSAGTNAVVAAYDPALAGVEPNNMQEFDYNGGTWRLSFYPADPRYYITVSTIVNGRVFVIFLVTAQSQYETDIAAVDAIITALQFTE